jgi:transposase
MCGIYDHASQRKWRHLDTLKYKNFICYRLPRMKNSAGIAQVRTKQFVEQLLEASLTTGQQQKVKTISMDMWKAYISQYRQRLPNARIVYYRFHLFRNLNQGIDKVRHREVKTLQKLKSTRYVVLKNQQNLTKKQPLKFEAIRVANYQVSKAWRVRENFKDLFYSQNKHDGVEFFCKWAGDALNRQIKEVAKVVDMFISHLSGVVNALVYTYSNAMADRLNGKIQQIK